MYKSVFKVQHFDPDRMAWLVHLNYTLALLLLYLFHSDFIPAFYCVFKKISACKYIFKLLLLLNSLWQQQWLPYV